MNISSNQKINFGTDGWRGIIADDFTFPNVWKVTRAIAAYLETVYPKNCPVLVGYDTRFLAPEFAKSAACILAELGWNVLITDSFCPTPVIAYQAKLLNSAGALMFTASHNAARYCGIKYIPDYAGPATDDITNKIVANLDSASILPPKIDYPGPIVEFNPKTDYFKFITNSISFNQIRSANLKVHYDALYSTSRGYLDEILRQCNCEVFTLHNKRDVLFGGQLPEPSFARLAQLKDSVITEHADLGVATDGDGDRFGIIDEVGNFVPPNIILLILARHLMKNKGKTGAIVRTLATTHLLDRFAAQNGLELYETPVGFKYIGEKMRQTQVLIGGEESGGLSIDGHIPEKDGILANLLVIEALAYEGKPLSMLVEEAIATVGEVTFNHRFDLKFSTNEVSKMLQYYKSNPPEEIAGIKVKQISYQDGIKLYLEDNSWILLRASGTEPLMRVYLETDSLKKQNKLVKYMNQTIENITKII